MMADSPDNNNSELTEEMQRELRQFFGEFLTNNINEEKLSFISLSIKHEQYVEKWKLLTDIDSEQEYSPNDQSEVKLFSLFILSSLLFIRHSH